MSIGCGSFFYFPQAYKSYALDTSGNFGGLPSVIPEGLNATRKSELFPSVIVCFFISHKLTKATL